MMFASMDVGAPDHALLLHVEAAPNLARNLNWKFGTKRCWPFLLASELGRLVGFTLGEPGLQFRPRRELSSRISIPERRLHQSWQP